MLTIYKRMIIGGKYRWKKKLISNLGIAGLFPTGRQPLVRRRGSVWAELAHREPVTWPRGLRHRGFHRSSPIRRRSGTLLDQLGRICYSRIQRWPALCFHQQHQVFLTAFLRKKSILKIKMNHQIFIIKSITGDFNWFHRDHPRELCLTARNAKPYPVLPAGTPDRPRLQLHYTICSAPDLRAVHQVRAIQQSTIYRCFFFFSIYLCKKKIVFNLLQIAMDHFWKKPRAVPNQRMLTYPIWSTWALYKSSVNQSLVAEFARKIRDNGFNYGQLELDDRWETCYGQMAFDLVKFPDPALMVQQLHQQVRRWAAWVPSSDNCCK